MLTLIHALQDETADHWRVVAQFWEIKLPGRDPLPALVSAMLDPILVGDKYLDLPEEARHVINALRAAGGKLPWAVFSHRFGEIREMGSARRQREQPWRDPVSPVERLWYGGWIGRSFIRVGGTSQEYAFLPADLEAMLPATDTGKTDGWRLISYRPAKDEVIRKAGFALAEDACTLMAYLRAWPSAVERPPADWIRRGRLRRHLRLPEALPMLLFILKEQDILEQTTLQPNHNFAKEFLELSLPEAAGRLIAFWMKSGWNDLEQSCCCKMPNGWPERMPDIRSHYLRAVLRAPRVEWCTVDSLLAAMHQTDLEFLRPASAFDSWMVQNPEGDFLSGLDSWWQVEGVFARYLISGPMVWLGMAEIAPADGLSAFRLTSLVDEKDAPTQPRKDAPNRTKLRSDGTILLAEGTGLMLRYQVARCSEWMGYQGGVYLYRITPVSLKRAAVQGIRVAHILPMLEKLGGGLPEKLVRSLWRWEECGAEVGIRQERLLVARTGEAAEALATALRGSSDWARKVEGTVWVVSPYALNRLRSKFSEAGFLVDEPIDPEDDPASGVGAKYYQDTGSAK